MAGPPRKDVQRFFHINVNCTNFAESLSFYQLVGFEKILDFDETSGPVRSFGQAGLGPVLGLPTIVMDAPPCLRSRTKAARHVST